MLCFFVAGGYIGKDGSKVTTVVATPGQGPDRPQEVSYTDTKVIGNGSFGVVYQAKLCETNEFVAIKKVLQDKRFKVSPSSACPFILPTNFLKLTRNTNNSRGSYWHFRLFCQRIRRSWTVKDLISCELENLKKKLSQSWRWVFYNWYDYLWDLKLCDFNTFNFDCEKFDISKGVGFSRGLQVVSAQTDFLMGYKSYMRLSLVYFM